MEVEDEVREVLTGGIKEWQVELVGIDGGAAVCSAPARLNRAGGRRKGRGRGKKGTREMVSCMPQNSKQRSFVWLITIFSFVHETY